MSPTILYNLNISLIYLTVFHFQPMQKMLYIILFLLLLCLCFLHVFTVSFLQLTVANIKQEMEKTLHWLVPIATNTAK
jgi:hypothetical protein